MAIRSRVVTKTTTWDPKNPEGGYIYGMDNKTRRKLSAAEQQRANREFDKSHPGYRQGRNVSIAGDNKLQFTGSYGLYVGGAIPPKASPAPAKTSTTPAKQERVEIGKLPLRSTQSILDKRQAEMPKPELVQKKLTTKVPVAIEKPKKVKVDKVGGVRLVKENTFRKNRQSGPFKNLRQDVKSKVTGVKITGRASKAERMAAKETNKSTRAARRTFGKEERLAAGYLKNQGIFEGETKKEMKAGIKSYAKAKRAEPGKMDKTTKQSIKAGKTAARYLGKLEKGKIRSFTPEALGRTKEVSAKVQTTTVGKGKNKKTVGVAVVPTKKSTRMQAGRYVY